MKKTFLVVGSTGTVGWGIVKALPLVALPEFPSYARNPDGEGEGAAMTMTEGGAARAWPAR